MSVLELKIPPALQVLVLALAMWGLSWSTATFSLHIPGKISLSCLFIGAGGAIALAGVAAFKMAGTTVNPITPEKSSVFVSIGVYRWSRNPMYLGFLLALIGWAIFLSNIPALALLPVFVFYMNRFQIYPEERAMYKRFGAVYLVYMEAVRRWI